MTEFRRWLRLGIMVFVLPLGLGMAVHWWNPPFYQRLVGLGAEQLFFIVLFLGGLALVLGFQSVHAERRYRREVDELMAFAVSLHRGSVHHRLREESGQISQPLRRELNRLADLMAQQVEVLQRLSTSREELIAQVQEGAVLEERGRLARELHDSVSQQMFALLMMAESQAEQARGGDVALQEQAEIIVELASRVQQEMRALILHLRPLSLQNQDLQGGLLQLLDEIEQRSSVAIDRSISKLPALPSGLENQLFRVMQEALTNVLRHAEASHVEVGLQYRRGEIVAWVHDNGKGFEVERRRPLGVGVLSMNERCEEIGARLQLTSRIGGGTRVELRMPFRPEKAVWA